MADILIHGDWSVGEGEAIRSINPANGSVYWSGHQASNEQVSRAIEAAKTSQASWAHADVNDRVEYVRAFASYLDEHRDELAQLISDEVGKPLWESLTEVAASIGKVSLSIDAMQQRRPTIQLEGPGAVVSTQRYRELGVMLVLGPFNFPAHLPGGQIIPALLAGNTIVFKPSELTPAVGQWLCEAWEQSGLPPGVLNLVQGDHQVATTMIDDPRISGVLFTGSYRAGCAIHQRLAGRPEVLLALEMGGNNPLILSDPSDSDAAVLTIIQSAYATSGQRCTCARRLIVIDTPDNRACIEQLVQAISRIRCGLPGSEPEPFIGPVVSAQAARNVLAAFNDRVERGGKALVECRQLPRCDALLSPGLVDMTSLSIPDDECFGPLMQLQYVTDFDEAMEQASATRFGLAAGLIGGTRQQFDALLRKIPAGVINWNSPTTGASGRLAFGGFQSSGNHRPAGFFAADFCSGPVSSVESDHLELPSTMPIGLDQIFPL